MLQVRISFNGVFFFEWKINSIIFLRAMLILEENTNNFWIIGIIDKEFLFVANVFAFEIIKNE